MAKHDSKTSEIIEKLIDCYENSIIFEIELSDIGEILTLGNIYHVFHHIKDYIDFVLINKAEMDPKCRTRP